VIEYRNASIPGRICRSGRGLSVRRLSAVLAVAANMGPNLVPCRAGWKKDIGFTLLQSRLGPGTPTGAGIPVAQIETSVGIGLNYLPDSTVPQSVHKAINALSIVTGVSSHATTAGRYYSDPHTSLSPGIHLVNVYEANDWCAQGFLILTAGRPKARSSSNVGTIGWDCGSAAPAVHRQYFFSIPTFSHADSVSILVTWYRLITVGPGVPITLTPSLANIDPRRPSAATEREPVRTTCAQSAHMLLSKRIRPLTSGESNE